MKPTLVADIGNSRIKWGLCQDDQVGPLATLPLDDSQAWQAQLDAWGIGHPQAWAISGVQPHRRDGLVAWLRCRGDRVLVLESFQQLPLVVQVDQPEHVGMDRLLNAVAANARRQPEQSAVIVDAGSAVTVDWVDSTGAFRGGAIFPGLRLMAQALHDYTALLPLVSVPRQVPVMPARSTEAAISAGIFGAAAGGIEKLIAGLRFESNVTPVVYLAGGDAVLLAAGLNGSYVVWPQITLEGIRLSAEALP
jgi:type III pantothenate kinase